MDIAAVVKNPWVWGIGLTVGLVALAVASGPKGQVDTVFNPNDVSSLGGLQGAQAAAGSAYASNMAEIAANANVSFGQQQTTRTLKVLDAIQNAAGVFTTVMQQANETAAGVVNSAIQANVALAVDRNANETRRDMIYVAGDVSKFTTQADGRVSVTNNLISSQAAKDGIAANASNEALGHLIDFTKVMAGMIAA